MSRNKELVKNTAIIFVGKLFTQFISFILIPIYTFFLDTTSYGYIDLVQTYITLIVPILILRFDSSIFRFLIDVRNDEKKKSSIISSSFFVIFIQLVIFLLVMVICSKFITIKYIVAIIINIIVLSVSSLLLQIPRGNGNMTKYSIASIICGITTTIFTILFIVYLKFDASYILFASSIGNLICIIYLFITEKIYNSIKISFINKTVIKDMTKYSLPMIPDSLSWWVVNVSDRTIITAILGVVYNGIYAISCKFSNILATFFIIFNLSWQESASVHINDNDNNVFFSDILNKSIIIFSILCVGIMVAIPFVYSVFIGKEYLSSYVYIPILLLGNLFNSLANVTGGIYIAMKKTSKVARTTILGAIINIIFNIIFIKTIGLWAAAISTVIAYMVVCVYRYIDIRKYIDLKVNYLYIVYIFIYFCLSLMLYYINNFILNIVNLIVTILISIIFSKDYIISFINRKKRV